MKIAAYNDHRVDSFLPSLGRFPTTNLLTGRSRRCHAIIQGREATLSGGFRLHHHECQGERFSSRVPHKVTCHPSPSYPNSVDRIHPCLGASGVTRTPAPHTSSPSVVTG